MRHNLKSVAGLLLLIAPSILYITSRNTKIQSDHDIHAIPIANKTENFNTDNQNTYSHNLGMIISNGQTLQHSFSMSNPGDKLLRIISANPIVPCCSSIGSIPNQIPPKSNINIPVTYTPGYQNGDRRIEFEVETDSADRPIKRFTLSASLIPAVEIEEKYNSSTSVIPMGCAEKLGIRITCRRQYVGGRWEGQRLPDFVRAGKLLKVNFEEAIEKKLLRDAIHEESRPVAIDILPSNIAGHTKEEIVFNWNGGQEFKHSMSWQVTPHITVSPEAIVLSSHHTSEVNLIVRSDERPIKVLKVTGNVLANEFQAITEPKRLHNIKVSIVSASARSFAANNLVIETDHPQQPTAMVSVLTIVEDNGSHH